MDHRCGHERGTGGNTANHHASLVRVNLACPMFAHGDLAPLIRAALAFWLIAALLATGLIIAVTSKTDRGWLIGSGLCLCSVMLLLLFLADPGGISSRFLKFP